MSVIAKYWIFNVVMAFLFFSFSWKAFENPKYLIGAFGAFVILGIASDRFRCPRCGDPILKRQTNSRGYGYYWVLPTSRTCTKCGRQL
jgi:hypothetical protein